jgi:hypothetical protein
MSPPKRRRPPSKAQILEHLREELLIAVAERGWEGARAEAHPLPRGERPPPEVTKAEKGFMIAAEALHGLPHIPARQAGGGPMAPLLPPKPPQAPEAGPDERYPPLGEREPQGSDSRDTR